MKLARVALLFVFVALAYGCKALSLVEPSGAAEGAVPAVNGRHLGFDTYAYPGDRTMREWKRESPYEWVGYYLPAPCHRGTSWSGKRSALESMGWGLAVIYVGQQWWTTRPKDAAARTALARKEAPCGNFRLTTPQGHSEADDAIARTQAEGFPPGSVIFLDIEYMDRVPQVMRDYYRAWVARVLEDGRYRPGVYVHHRNAPVVHADVRALFEEAGVVEPPHVWIASGRVFSKDKFPHESGHAFASVWQGVLDTEETYAGIRLPIDVNVSAVPSPSLWGAMPTLARGSSAPGVTSRETGPHRGF